MVDAKLMERTGLDEFSLRRLRKEFMNVTRRMPYKERRAMCEAGTVPRFRLMVKTMRTLWTDERWVNWLTYLEHTQTDIDEMCTGEYPVYAHMIRVFSALFGIKVDFLLLGSAPSADREGANIDIGPLTGTP
jgi:hypothetical protein